MSALWRKVIVIMNIDFGTNEDTWKIIHEKVSYHRYLAGGDFSVIDIGGTMHGHSGGIADLIVDLNCTPDDRNIKFDICDETQWSVLEDIVNKRGKFDYAICTHTLEDLYNPITVLKWLPRIAKSGIVTMPSITTELGRHEHGTNSPWLGYMHHRWIFDQEDGEMLVIPKITLLESMLPVGMLYDTSKYEIRYQWVDNIPFQIFMNNFLGPTVQHVVDAYSELINSRL